MAKRKTEEDGPAHGSQTETDVKLDARSVIALNCPLIASYLEFRDNMMMVNALKLCMYPCPYTKVEVKGRRQVDFLLNHKIHFNYLNLVIKLYSFVSEFLPLYANVKYVRLLGCLMRMGIPIMHAYARTHTLTNIHTLEIIKCRVTDIDNLHNMCHLKKLSLSDNNITKIKNLDHLTQLTHLDLSFNKIKIIENLEKLSCLISLDLSHNKITKIQNLQALTNVENIDISHNRVKFVENIWGIQKMSYLNVSYNRVQQICYIKNRLGPSIMTFRRTINAMKHLNLNNRTSVECFRRNMELHIRIKRENQKVTRIYNFILK